MEGHALGVHGGSCDSSGPTALRSLSVSSVGVASASLIQSRTALLTPSSPMTSNSISSPPRTRGTHCRREDVFPTSGASGELSVFVNQDIPNAPRNKALILEPVDC